MVMDRSNDVFQIVVEGTRSGRENDQEIVCFSAIGLSHIDTMLENTKFNKAAACGFGTVLPLQGMAEFEHEIRRKIFLCSALSVHIIQKRFAKPLLKHYLFNECQAMVSSGQQRLLSILRWYVCTQEMIDRMD